MLIVLVVVAAIIVIVDSEASTRLSMTQALELLLANKDAFHKTKRKRRCN